MSNAEKPDLRARLYEEGKKSDWKQDKSHAAATVARACFRQAADLGPTGALRSLAHMIYDGHGGARDKEQGLLLLWSAFMRGDKDALEELADLLASFSEDDKTGVHAEQASKLATMLESVSDSLASVERFMQEIALRRAQSDYPGDRTA